MRRALPLLLLLLANTAEAQHPTLLYNGRILVDASAPPDRRFAEGALVVDGRFVAVGTVREAESAAHERSLIPTRVDLHGRFAVPALTDAHGHIEGLGHALQRLRLEGTKSAEAIAAMVAERAKTAPAGQWILGRGWDQNDWAVQKFPSRELLDRVAPNHPVWLRRVDGHAAWCNTKALELAGVTKATPEVPGGRIERARGGAPTGVLVDNAMSLVEAKIPAPDRGQRVRAIVLALRHCVELGLTAVHDAGVDGATLRIYRELAERDELPLRVFAMLSAESAWAPNALPEVKPTYADGRFRLFGVKAYADGALGSRGAALLAGYSDDRRNVGLVRTSADTLELLARRCLERGYSLCVHAIGDRGNRMVLDAFERAAAAGPGTDTLRHRRFRIEHAQVVSLDDIPRFAKLGVIASMQPTHCTSDMPWAPARLGAARVQGAYAWRRMLDAGARLAFGSDFPVEDANPLLGLYAAVTTQDVDGRPTAGYRASEKLTIWEALQGFTRDAAYAAFAEGELGRAAPGFRADLSVFDRDLTAIPVSEIPKARCTMTMVGGFIMWDSGP